LTSFIFLGGGLLTDYISGIEAVFQRRELLYARLG
jgi:hypothetical protein